MELNKREPLLALIFGVLATGLGQIYVGQARKGILLIAFQFIIIFVFAIAGLISTLYGFWTLFILAGGIHIYSILDAAITAHKANTYTLKPYNRPTCYLGAWFSLAILVSSLFSMKGSILGYETYQIPSNSMAPTISAGDYILVNTRNQSPRVGNVIVYRSNGVGYVKRVAAIENDRISIDSGNIILNNKNIGSLSAPKDRITKDYSISMKETIIDSGKVFLLGDNRDSSNDSRFVGSIPSAQIIGTVTSIWLSEDLSRIGLKIE